MEELFCKDCRFYLPVDVFTGLCKISKKSVIPDDSGCEKSEKSAKCKFCMNFTSEREYLGKCMESTLAYPDMNAIKCEFFKWIERN